MMSVPFVSSYSIPIIVMRQSSFRFYFCLFFLMMFVLGMFSECLMFVSPLWLWSLIPVSLLSLSSSSSSLQIPYMSFILMAATLVLWVHPFPDIIILCFFTLLPSSFTVLVVVREVVFI